MVEMDGGVGVAGGAQTPAPAPRRWRLVDERCDLRAMETDYVRRFHRHEPRDHQCSSAVAKHIKAPVHLVWSLVRRFDQPQLFKPFVSRCEMKGNIEIGSVREVNVKSGLPATRSTERLELLDDNEHILSVRFVGGDHRLQNYSSILTVHPEVIDGRPGTLVIESFVVDVPEGNTKDETCYFVEALLKCNLKSLAEVSERQVIKDQTEPCVDCKNNRKWTHAESIQSYLIRRGFMPNYTIWSKHGEVVDDVNIPHDDVNMVEAGDDVVVRNEHFVPPVFAGTLADDTLDDDDISWMIDNAELGFLNAK